MIERLTEASCVIVELAEKLGVSNIKDLPGAWFHGQFMGTDGTGEDEFIEDMKKEL